MSPRGHGSLRKEATQQGIDRPLLTLLKLVTRPEGTGLVLCHGNLRYARARSPSEFEEFLKVDREPIAQATTPSRKLKQGGMRQRMQAERNVMIRQLVDIGAQNTSRLD